MLRLFNPSITSTCFVSRKMSSVTALLAPFKAELLRDILRKVCSELNTTAGIITGLLSPKLELPRSRDLCSISCDSHVTDINIAPFPLTKFNGLTSAPEAIWDSILLWAVPKKRTSHSKKRMRMAHKYLKPKCHYQTCTTCGNLKLQHMLCGHCFKVTMKETAKFRRKQMELVSDKKEQPSANIVSSSSSS